MSARRGRSWRAGRVSGPAIGVVGSLVIAGLLVVALGRMSDQKLPPKPTTDRSSVDADSAADDSDKSGEDQDGPLLVYCAAALKKSVEAIAKRYEAECGTEVQLQYGPSQTLLANVEVSRTGDLYIPADDSYLTTSEEKQLTVERIPLARMHAVLAVAKGNPKQLTSLEGFLASDAKLALANPDAAAISALAREHLSKKGLWEKFLERVAVQKATVTEVAADVGVGAVDAALVWDVTARDFEGVEAVEDEVLEGVAAHVAAGVLRSTRQPRAALKFARYLAAADRGLKEFSSRGFQVIDGDPWETSPELVLYAGSMLRPAIEDTITDFERREGVRVTRVYNGCGILVAEMKAGRLPDAYFACDREFMAQVKDVFPDSADLATNQLVILVKKGNPFKIRGLQDLTREGLRVGIGHEKQCAMGWLTQRTFREAKVGEQVMKNVVVQTPTGDMLVNQMRAGSLDAAVAYLSNAVNSGDELDAIAIENLPCAIAVQPFGIAKEGKHREIMTRLFRALRSAESRQRFVEAGFQWGEAEPTP